MKLDFIEDPTTYYIDGNYDSFSSHADYGKINLEAVLWYTPLTNQVPEVQLTGSPVTSKSNWEPMYAPANFVKALNRLKKSYGKVDRTAADNLVSKGEDEVKVWARLFRQARDRSNPYEKLGKGRFINRAAVKLANVAWVTNLFSPKNPKTNQVSDELLFADIAGGPGGFVEYIQQTYPRSRGYGVTLQPPPGAEGIIPNWDKRLQYLREGVQVFTPYNGNDETGNLYTMWADFVNMLKGSQTPELDLVTADGGFDVGDGDDGGNYKRQEYLSSHLILLECHIGLLSLKAGGNLVVKVFDTFSRFMGDLIYLVSQCFSRVCLLKPCSSRPANSERYLVCQSYHGLQQSLNTVGILNAVAKSYQVNPENTLDTTFMVDSILATAPPADFASWLSLQNKRSVQRQITAGREINAYMLYLSLPEDDERRKQIIVNEPPAVDLQKAFILWGIDDAVVGHSDNNPLFGVAFGQKYE